MTKTDTPKHKHKLSVAREPCASCPYRQDVPSGVWSREEYLKLPDYDGSILHQLMRGAMGMFMCHQRDGRLCAGWLACHGAGQLAAMRFVAVNEPEVDPRVWDYDCETPLWASGEEACEHGLRDIEAPGREALAMMETLIGKGKETRDG